MAYLFQLKKREVEQKFQGNSFASLQEAKDYVSSSSMPWKYVKCQNDNIYYDCRKCTMKIKLHSNKFNAKVILWITEGEHNHQALNRGIDIEVKDEILTF